MNHIFFASILLLIIFFSIFYGNSNETFKSKKIKYTLPQGNSNNKQTQKLTKNLLKNGSQAKADAKYDSQVGSIDDLNAPSGTTT